MFRHKVPAIKVARDRLLDLPVEQARTGLWFSEGCAVLANWPTRSTPA